MDENNIFISREYALLKCSLYNHLWIFILITIMNIILYIRIYFVYKIFEAFFLIAVIIYFFFIFIPIYPIFLLKKRLFKIKAKILEKISKYNIIIFLISAFILNLMLFLNVKELFSFYKECPYNFSYNDIARIFNINYNGRNISSIKYQYSKKCSDNRCLYIDQNVGNPLPYTFICNFDSAFDFKDLMNKIDKTLSSNNKEDKSNSYISCEIFDEEIFNRDRIFIEKNVNDLFIIESYYHICSSKKQFYKCDRSEAPTKYDIKYDFSCPTLSDNIISFIISIFSAFLNIIIAAIIIIMEYVKYKKILEIYHQFHINPQASSTRNDTKSSSESRNISNTNNKPETLIVMSRENRREVNEETQNDRNYSLNVVDTGKVLKINKLNNDNIITINKIKDEAIKNELISNQIDNSDRKKINSINNNINEINGNSDNYNNENNFIEIKHINFQETNNDIE